MARPDGRRPDLRVDVPTLEPDPALLARLSELAVGSGAGRPSAVTSWGHGWRAGLAAAAVATVIGGGAWLATSTGGEGPSTPPDAPATRPDQSTGGGEPGASDTAPPSGSRSSPGPPTDTGPAGGGAPGRTGRGPGQAGPGQQGQGPEDPGAQGSEHSQGQPSDQAQPPSDAGEPSDLEGPPTSAPGVPPPPGEQAGDRRAGAAEGVRGQRVDQ